MSQILENYISLFSATLIVKSSRTLEEEEEEQIHVLDIYLAIQ
jgi:hypothetical protein